MNYIKDNTVSDPSGIFGAPAIGDTYLVPPVGSGGLWAGQEDKLARKVVSGWSFTDAVPGAEYQVDSGPNIGAIYTRTTTVLPTTNIVPNGNLNTDIDFTPQWSTGTTGSATVDWSGGAIHLDCPASPSHSCFAKVEIPTIAGVRYNLTYVLSGLVSNNTDQFAKLDIREMPADLIISDPTLIIGENSLTFVAVSALTTIAFTLANDGSASAVSSVDVDSLTVFRVAEHVKNGDFTDDFTDWTSEFPWEPPTDSGFDGAYAEIDYPGHTPFPSLRQTVTGMTAGVFYRVAFNPSANFSRGVVSLAMDGTVLADVTESGPIAFFYRASATSHVLEFPLTYTGGGVPFEFHLEDVSIMTAPWIADPVGKPVIHGQSTVLCSAVCPLTVAATIVAASLVTSVATADHNILDARITSASLVTTKSTAEIGIFVTANILGKSTITVPTVGSTFFGNPIIAAKSTVTVRTVNLGDYTAAMAVDSITELWSSSPCDCANKGCGTLQIAALECLNAAMQRLNASGREWGFVSNVSLSLGPKTSLDGEIDLPKDVIAVRRVVFEPALDADSTAYGSFVLRPVRSRHEIEAYRLSSDRLAWPLKPAESYLAHSIIPIGYFVEAEDLRSTTGNGPPSLRIMFGPKFSPATPYKVEVQAHIEPPRLTCQSLAEGTVLPIPHRFAETLLVPLAKYYALSSRWFRREDLREAVQLQARDALMLTGELQPAAPEAGKEERSKAP